MQKHEYEHQHYSVQTSYIFIDCAYCINNVDNKKAEIRQCTIVCVHLDCYKLLKNNGNYQRCYFHDEDCFTKFHTANDHHICNRYGCSLHPLCTSEFNEFKLYQKVCSECGFYYAFHKRDFTKLKVSSPCSLNNFSLKKQISKQD